MSDEQKQSSLGKKAADAAKIVADKKLGKYKRKIIVKIAKWIVAGCTAIAGICAPIFAFIYLPLIIVLAVVSMFSNLQVYKQECPELVRVFLSENYNEFEEKVKYYSEQPYVKEQIAGLAFDNAYYNLVLGGYVNADTSQIINNDLVTYNEKKDSYTVKTVMDSIEQLRKDKGNDVLSKITIKDDYLSGLSSSSLPGEENVEFEKWYPSFFYNVPAYFAYQGTANIRTIYYLGVSNYEHNVYFSDLSKLNVPYSEYISNIRDTSGNKLELSKEKQSLVSKIDNSKYGFNTSSILVFNTKNKYEYFDNKNFYDVADSKMETYGNRIGASNTTVDEWNEVLAEYIAKYIYYVYPNRDYIMDKFLSDDANAQDCMEFLAKSYKAIASGSELEYMMKDTYTIQNGYVYGDNTENVDGTTKIQSINLKKIKPERIEYAYQNSEGAYGMYQDMFFDTSTVTKAKADMVKQLGELPTQTADGTLQIMNATYQADVELTSTDSSKETIKNGASIVLINGQLRVTLNKNCRKHLKQVYSATFSDSYISEQGWSQEVIDNLEYKANGLKKTIDINVETLNTSTETVTLSNSDVKNALNSVSSYNVNGITLLAFLNGTVSNPSQEPIKIQYNDKACFSWHLDETRDENGEIKSYDYSIDVNLPDVDKIGNNDSYRIALGIEKPEAITEAFKLLGYATEHNSLDGVSKEVDFDKIFINNNKTKENYSSDINETYITSNNLADQIIELIFGAETGGRASGYLSARNPISGTREKTITVGFVQWYGGRAHNILRKMCNAQKDFAKSTLGEALYDEIQGNSDWVSSCRIFSSAELDAIKKLLATDTSKTIQNEQAVIDINAYIDEYKKYGITNDKLIAYLCTIKHQSPATALTIMYQCINHYGDAAAFSSAEDGLDYLHTLTINNEVTSKYRSHRYIPVYNAIRKLKTETEDVYEMPLNWNDNWRFEDDYGDRTLGGSYDFHQGIDLSGKAGTKIYAAKSGEVVFAGMGVSGSGYGGYGYCVCIYDGKYYALYGHMQSSPKVKKGDHVDVGQLIGYMGATGQVTGVHLHFEIMKVNTGVHNAETTIDPVTLMRIIPDLLNKHGLGNQIPSYDSIIKNALKTE